ncbi:hypothetical protein G9A89_016250 [Geosiphon pyriformis]|nr:hypothetical protein G9A89_016250 [Geosiphon pyriformis]
MLQDNSPETFLQSPTNNLTPPNQIESSPLDLLDSELNNIENSKNLDAQDFKAAIPLLSEGFLEQWTPILKQVEEELRTFEEKQCRLLDEIQTTGSSIENQDGYEFIAQTFSRIPEYTVKLQYIRSTMLLMLSRSKQLKRRVALLKSIKDQQLAQVAKIQLREQNFDQTVLAAKVVATPEMQTIVLKSSRKKKKEKGKDKEKEKSTQETSNQDLDPMIGDHPI